MSAWLLRSPRSSYDSRMKVFEMPAKASPREQGRAHGEAFRPLIAELAEIRLGLCITQGGFVDSAAVRASASAHLPLLTEQAPELYEELLGIAEGAGLSPELLIVLNHYTDLRDLGAAAQRWASTSPAVSAADGDECSLLFAASERGSFLAQTWDTHASATPYVMMLRVPSRGDAPAAWLLSITGCLGMIGLNAAGIAVGVNNLTSLDARVGLVWPALVRLSLEERSAAAARDRIVAAPVGSGHHYCVASARAAFGIETSGERKAQVFDHDAAASPAREAGPVFFAHTNHALDASIAEVTALRPTSTTLERYERLLHAGARAPLDRDTIWATLSSHEGYPRSVCAHLGSPAEPHAVSTCALIAMDLRAKQAMTLAGCGHRTLAHRFDFEGVGDEGVDR